MVEAMNEEARLGADRVRSVAQLNMLHSLAARLNSLGDVDEIGAAIAAELRTIVDYHNCRVYVLQPDGTTLWPVAFSGDISTEYVEETIEDLASQVGEGITGGVAASRESLLTPDAREVDFSVLIPGTDDILESMLAVPMLAGNEVSGRDRRCRASATGSSTRTTSACSRRSRRTPPWRSRTRSCFQAEREAAETSAALLRLSQVLTGMHTTDAILGEAM